MKDLKGLAKRGQIIGAAGTRSEKSLWRVAAILPAKRDADRLFKRLPDAAKIVAIDHARNLSLFPDKRATVDGLVLDLAYEKITGEVFSRLVVNDDLFSGRSLRVFFYPQHDERSAECGRRGTIWIVGLSWRPGAYKKHLLSRCRRRVDEIINQGR